MAKTAFVTGANGRIGHNLLPALKAKGYTTIALDIDEISKDLPADEKIKASILEPGVIASVMDKNIDVVFHLASTLAVTSELDPDEAHDINATGTVRIFSESLKASEKNGKSIQIIFPSSISVYGLPDVATKESVVVTEDEYVNPQTMYGTTKLYCEQLGAYYSDRYKLLDDTKKGSIDFRALRIPGIITKFASNMDAGKYAGLTMIHAPAESGGYEIYVKQNTVLPFITMEDVINALLAVAEAPKEKLTRRVYNVSGFPASVKELTEMITKELPDAKLSESLDPQRQTIVDTWPQAIDDSKAREDWGWNPSSTSLV
jgi:threonine 3-dehydrogenase